MHFNVKAVEALWAIQGDFGNALIDIEKHTLLSHGKILVIAMEPGLSTRKTLAYVCCGISLF